MVCGVGVVDTGSGQKNCNVTAKCSTIETSPSTCTSSYGGKFIHATQMGTSQKVYGYGSNSIIVSGLTTCKLWKRTPTGGTTGTCFYNCSISPHGIKAVDLYCDESYTVYN